MARIVLIAAGSKQDTNNIDDVVSVHDDDVELTGPGYANFRILDMPGVPVRRVMKRLSNNKRTFNPHKYTLRNLDATEQEAFRTARSESDIDDVILKRR